MDESEAVLPTFNPFQMVLELLANYGWWAIGVGILASWIYNKAGPKVQKWKIEKEDAEYHKDPDVALKRMEAIENARAKQQKLLEQTAKDFQEKEKLRLEKKRQEFIDKNSGKAQKLGSNADYLPLCGPGTSGGYRPPKKSKCSGGGCG